MVFTPLPANESFPCNGLDLYEASRPPLTVSFQTGNLVAFLFSVSFWAFAAIWFYRARKTTRMRVVRPLFLNWLLCASAILFSCSWASNLAIPNLPCGILLFSFLFGIAGFAVNFFTRAIVFVVESQFAKTAGKHALKFDELGDLTSQHSGVSTDIGAWKSSTTGASLIVMARLLLGLSSFEQITLVEVVGVRNSYKAIALLSILPGALPALVILTIKTQYRHCAGCAIFFEPLLGFITAISIYVIAALRILWFAWKSQFTDSHGIFRELVFICIPVGISALGACILLAVDPVNVEFNRDFMFEWIIGGFSMRLGLASSSPF